MSRIQWVVGLLCFHVVGKYVLEFSGDIKGAVDGCVVVVVGWQSSAAGASMSLGQKGYML